LERPARQERREVHLLATDRRHLLAHDGLDLCQDAQPEREPGVDARCCAADITGPHEELVGGDLRVDGVFAQRAQEQGGHAEHAGQPSGRGSVGVRARPPQPGAVLASRGAGSARMWRRREGHVAREVAMTSTTPAGWYPDPDGLASLRWWDGAWWTLWESDGARLWPGTTTPARRATVDDLPALAFVRTSFLPEARRRRVLDGLALAELTRLTDQLAGEVGGPRAVPHVVPAPSGPPRAAAPWPPAVEHSRPVPAAPPRPPAAPPPAPAAPSAPPAASSTPPAAVPYPVPSAPAAARTSHAGEPRPVRREPGRIARWWATSRVRLDTDLTVHGLTYLGVLLLFVGVFGLVAFAFGDVAPGLRPVAGLAVAAVPFAAAWLLARSGARFVARAMVAVGALILPVMLVTSTVDGAAPPPDLHGAALPLGAGLACAAVAGAYVVRVRTNPGSVLGVMVAPVLWLAAGMAAVGLGRPVPHGEDVAVPGSAQVAVIALA